MFTATQEIAGEHTFENTAPPDARSIRDLGLKMQGGGLVLPDLPLDVSSVLVKAPRDALMARFALQAEKAGFNLSADAPSENLSLLLDQMLADYCQRKVIDQGEMAPLLMQLHFGSDQVVFVAEADTSLPIIELKAPIEEINAYYPDLGWLISDVISDGHQYGFSTYDPNRIDSEVVMYEFNGAESDVDFFDMCCSDSTEDEGWTDEMKIAYVHENYSCYPSAYRKAMGGEPKLMSWRPKSKAWLAENLKASCADDRLSPNARAVLRQCTEVRKAFSKLAPFRNNRVEVEEQIIGAMAFVLWEESELILETIGHHEQNWMGGDSTTCLITSKFVITDAQSLRAFIRNVKDYLHAYQQFTRLLRMVEHFKDESCLSEQSSP